MTGVMLQFIIAVWFGLSSPQTTDLADGALRTAPQYLTAETAREHALAAMIAGKVHNVDPALLLSVAWHESRYETDAVSHEPGGKVSCGPMTPVPMKRCPPPSLLGGYLAGAKHLRGWIEAQHGNMTLALQGYAGGYAQIAACARGEDSRGCRVPGVFLWRAAWIRQRGVS